MSSNTPLLDPAIFNHLKDKLEEETQIRDALTQIIQRLERAVAAAQGILSRVHSTPRARCECSSHPKTKNHTNHPPVPELVSQVEEKIKEEVAIVGELNELASKQPYYKYVTSTEATTYLTSQFPNPPI